MTPTLFTNIVLFAISNNYYVAKQDLPQSAPCLQFLTLLKKRISITIRQLLNALNKTRTGSQ